MRKKLQMLLILFSLFIATSHSTSMCTMPSQFLVQPEPQIVSWPNFANIRDAWKYLINRVKNLTNTRIIKYVISLTKRTKPTTQTQQPSGPVASTVSHPSTAAVAPTSTAAVTPTSTAETSQTAKAQGLRT